jgi:hypothetical protein
MGPGPCGTESDGRAGVRITWGRLAAADQAYGTRSEDPIEEHPALSQGRTILHADSMPRRSALSSAQAPLRPRATDDGRALLHSGLAAARVRIPTGRGR